MSIPTLQEEHRRIAERPCGERINVCRCAGCGGELPDTENARDDHIYYEELRCDLCWRAMLAAEAAADPQRRTAAVAHDPLSHELDAWLLEVAATALR